MAKGRPAKIGPKADNRESRQLAVPNSALPVAVPPLPPSLPAEAQETWEVICASLPGLVIADCIGDVEICVRSLYEWRAISKLLDEHGYAKVLADEEGKMSVIHVPEGIQRLHKMRATAANTYRYHADRLGLSRMARARLNLLDLAAKSELAGLAERVSALRDGGL